MGVKVDVNINNEYFEIDLGEVDSEYLIEEIKDRGEYKPRPEIVQPSIFDMAKFSATKLILVFHELRDFANKEDVINAIKEL